jgi:hypothetical protein
MFGFVVVIGHVFVNMPGTGTMRAAVLRRAGGVIMRLLSLSLLLMILMMMT